MLGFFIFVLTIIFVIVVVVIVIAGTSYPKEEKLLKVGKFDIYVERDEFLSYIPWVATAHAKTLRYKIWGPSLHTKISGTRSRGKTEEEAVAECQIELQKLIDANNPRKVLSLKVVNENKFEEDEDDPI